MLILWFIFFTLLLLHLSIRYSRRGRLYSKIPGPKSYPIFGNIFKFALCDHQEFWVLARQLVRKYYPISRLLAFNQAVVNVCHPDDLEILLSSQAAIEKGYSYRYFEPWLKDGLLISKGAKWTHRRKLLTPAFHFGILKRYMDITREQGENMVESLKKKGDEYIVKDLTFFFARYSLNIICETTMGISLDKLDTRELKQYKQAVHDMSSIIVFRQLRPYLNDLIFPYVPKWGAMQKKALQVLGDFANKVIQNRREYHKNENDKLLTDYNNSDNSISIYDDTEIGLKKRMSMLDLLLAAEKNGSIDLSGIQEEVDTFVLAGLDTASVAMTFITLLLAENKEAQDRARAEITKIMDAANGKAGVSEVQEFHYLERCIKESLRLFPAVHSIMRYLREDIQLKHALIPAHTNVMIHLWDTHRDPNFWAEPDKFDPDRFLPENSKMRHPYSYLPFSAGPRNCIGQKFAMIELKILLSNILYNFYLEPIIRTDDLSIAADIVMKANNPVLVKFVKINK